MPIRQNITREHIIMAAAWIDRNGVPDRQQSREWVVIVNGKPYPPKYIVCLANSYPNQIELPFDEKRTSKAQKYLMNLGFRIVPKN